MANSSLWPVAHTPVLDDRFTGSEAHVGMGTLHTRRSVVVVVVAALAFAEWR
jgi:hypothetical protein